MKRLGLPANIAALGVTKEEWEKMRDDDNDDDDFYDDIYYDSNNDSSSAHKKQQTTSLLPSVKQPTYIYGYVKNFSYPVIWRNNNSDSHSHGYHMMNYIIFFKELKIVLRFNKASQDYVFSGFSNLESMESTPPMSPQVKKEVIENLKNSKSLERSIMRSHIRYGA